MTIQDDEARSLARTALQKAEDAREEAKEARLQVSIHEQVCVERYDNIRSDLQDLKTASEQRREAIRSIYGLLWAAVGALCLILLAVIGYLFDRNFNPMVN